MNNNYYFQVAKLEEMGKQPFAKEGMGDVYTIGLLRILNAPAFLFFTRKPLPAEFLPGTATGFYCCFNKSFLTATMQANINASPLFTPGEKSRYILNDLQQVCITGIFEKMIAEIQSDYLYKDDLLRNYIMEMLHTALKNTKQMYFSAAINDLQ